MNLPEARAGASKLEFAGLARRLLSLGYEVLLLAALLIVASIPFVVLAGSARNAPLKLAFQLYLLLIAGSYFSYCWVRGGQTLPMKTWHIRLVTATGEQVSPAKALQRFLFAFIGYGLGAVTIVWVFFDSDRQFLHDRLAGTRIISLDRISSSLHLPDHGRRGQEKDGGGERRAQDR